MHLFSNNAVATLAAPLTSGATTFTVAADGGADTFGVPGGSQVQLATLTDASGPNAHEVVLITGRSGNVFTVQRGQEDTVAAAWSAGAKISARVTAGMLRTFPQRLNGFLHTRMENPGSPDVCALGDYLTLPRRRASATNGNYYGWHDGSFGAEIIGTSAPCDLGEAITWNTSPHYHGAVVVPSTPDGFQYWLDMPPEISESYTSTPPTFNGTSDPTVAEHSSLGPVGFWIPTALPVSLNARFASGLRLAVTEVGFIADTVTATSTPSVSIGADGAATRFANAVALDQLTGNHSIHSIPIAAGGVLVEELQFVATTSATGGQVRGRFYWRGFFVDTNT